MHIEIKGGLEDRIEELMGKDKFMHFCGLLGYIGYSSFEGFYEKNNYSNEMDNYTSPLMSDSDFVLKERQFFRKNSLRVFLRKNEYNYHMPQLIRLYNYCIIKIEFDDDNNTTSYLECRLKEIESFFKRIAIEQNQDFSDIIDYASSLLIKRKHKSSSLFINYKTADWYFSTTKKDVILNLAIELKTSKCISRIDEFINIFLSDDLDTNHKANWEKELLSLIFLIKVLELRKIIHPRRGVWESLSMTFSHKNREINSSSLSSLASTYKLSTIGNTKSSIKKFTKSSNKAEFSEIYLILEMCRVIK